MCRLFFLSQSSNTHCFEFIYSCARLVGRYTVTFEENKVADGMFDGRFCLLLACLVQPKPNPGAVQRPTDDQSIRIPPQVSGSKMASFLFIVVAADCADVMARPYFSTYFLFKLKTNKRHNNNRLMFTVYIHIYTMLDNSSTVFTSKSCRLQGLSLIYSSLSIGMKWSILINHLTDWRQGKGFPFPFN